MKKILTIFIVPILFFLSACTDNIELNSWWVPNDLVLEWEFIIEWIWKVEWYEPEVEWEEVLTLSQFETQDWNAVFVYINKKDYELANLVPNIDMIWNHIYFKWNVKLLGNDWNYYYYAYEVIKLSDYVN